MCEEHGFTHTPLREALRALTAQGLVEYATNCGYRVPKPSAEELVTLHQVREGLEGVAAGLLALHATEAQLAELESLAVECDRLRDARQEYGVPSMTSDLQFHGLVALWSGNPLIPKLLLRPNILTRCFLRTSGFDTSGMHPLTHERIVSAIASADEQHAGSVMRAHIRECTDWLVTLATSSALDAGEE